MTTMYTTLVPTGDVVSYTSLTPDIEYMSSNIISTFGPIYAPKLYASELSALELASSGKIAITLLDEHAFDITDNSNNVILFTARDSNSFLLQTENNQSFLSLGNDSNAILSASNNLDLTASKIAGSATGVISLVSSASNVVVSAPVGVFDLDADSAKIDTVKTLDVTTGSTTTFTATTSNIVFNAAAGMFDVNASVVDVDASSTASITAVAVATLESTASNVKITAATGALDMDAVNVTLDATSSISAVSAANSTYKSLSGNLIFDAFDTFSVDATIVDIDSSGATKLVAGGPMSLASDSNVSVAAANEISLSASNDVSITSANSNVGVFAPNGDISVVAADGTITLDGQVIFTKGIGGISSLVSPSNIDIAAGSNVSTTAGGDIGMAASNAISVSAGTGAVTIESAGSNVDITAGDDIYITANSNVFVRAIDTNIELLADNNLLMRSTTGAASLTTDAGSITITSASNLIGSSVLATTVTAGTSVSLSAGTSATMAASNGLASVTGTSSSGNVVSALLSSSGAGNYTKVSAPVDGKQLFTIGAFDAIEIFKTSVFDPSDSNDVTGYKVRINADFEVKGSINSISVSQTVLEVEDKVIHLAYNSNLELPEDGPGNNGAGIIIDGVPSLHDPAIRTQYPERYAKSITWKTGTSGMLALGSSNIETESYWDVQGGAMRWTYVQEATGNEVSYIMRINEREEFEMVKRKQVFGSSPVFSRVAKFGRVLPL